jgi:hypothetical protein
MPSVRLHIAACFNRFSVLRKPDLVPDSLGSLKVTKGSDYDDHLEKERKKK